MGVVVTPSLTCKDAEKSEGSWSDIDRAHMVDPAIKSIVKRETKGTW
jgi:hypothetical protein